MALVLKPVTLLGIVLTLLNPAFAQDQGTSEAPVAAVAGEPSANQANEAAIKAAVLDKIIASRTDISTKIEQILQDLPQITESIERANETFDQIVATLKSQAELGNPNGEFVKQIDTLAEMARGDAAAARTAGYLDFEQEFLESAEGFTADRESAVQFYESLDRRIRAVEAQRERIVFVIKLQRYE